MKVRLWVGAWLWISSSGCAARTRSNTSRATMVWREVKAAPAEWERAHLLMDAAGRPVLIDPAAPEKGYQMWIERGTTHRVSGPDRSVYCPEPVGPATKLNDAKLTVKATTANISGSAANTQTLGKLYDLGDIIQFSQYATFMNCVAWANGVIDGKAYEEINAQVLHDTAKLIEAQVSAEARATVEAKAAAIKAAAAEAEEAKTAAAVASAAAEAARVPAPKAGTKGASGAAPAAPAPAPEPEAPTPSPADAKARSKEAQLKALQDTFGGR